jgi:hypothetical protein
VDRSRGVVGIAVLDVMRTIFPGLFGEDGSHPQEVDLEGAKMHQVVRGTRFLVMSALRILFGLTLIFARLFLLPALLAVFRILWAAISFSFTATVNGPRQFIDRLAGEWTERFHDVVRDRSNINEIYQLCRILVGARIVLGWVIFIAFTVAILRVVFGFFI